MELGIGEGEGKGLQDPLLLKAKQAHVFQASTNKQARKRQNSIIKENLQFIRGEAIQ